MANEYSIEWTGDQSFRILLNNLNAVCFITSLYGDTFNSVYGPLNCAVDSSIGIEWTQRVGLAFVRSGSGGSGTFLCTGINAVAPSYIEEVFILFGDYSTIKTRARDIAKGYASTQSTSGANNVIQNATWDAIVTRQQATPLATPTGLTSTSVTSSSARVGWNSVTNAVDYKVEYRVQGATNWTED